MGRYDGGSESLEVEVVPYALPFRKTYRAAPGSLDRRELVLLRIRDGSGVTGVGEAVPLRLRGGADLDSVVESLERWAGRVREAGVREPPAGPAPARCAVETALADLQARRDGIPLHVLLGSGDDPDEIRCNATLTADSAAELASQAEDLRSRGFTRFKLKVGMPGDRERVEALRGAIGDEGLMRLDANGAWSADDAVEFLELVGPDGIELLEQPTGDLPGMALVRDRVDVAVVADESVSSREEALEAARIGACDAVTVKISKVGGLDGSLGGHLPTYLSSALDGPVGLAAAGHLATTLPQQGITGPNYHGLATGELFDGTVALSGPTMDGDRLVLPEGPGTGVEIDEAALERFRL